MNNYRNRIKVICLSLLIVFSLTAARPSEVQIRTENGKPLIELDSLLVSTKIGQEGSSANGESVKETENSKPEKTVEKTTVSSSTNTIKKKEILSIIVRNKSISCKGMVYTYDKDTDSIPGFDDLLSSLEHYDEVIIKDEYAEYHAFNRVLESTKDIADKISVKTSEIIQEAE